MSFAKKTLIPLLPIVVAIVGVILLKKSQTLPVQLPVQEYSKPLRIMTISMQSVTPKISGFGIAQPPRVWKAVSEVKGRIVSVSDQLKSGAIFSLGETLIKIETTDYELAVARLESSVKELDAQIAGVKAEEVSNVASLELEKESLRLAEASLARLTRLNKTKAVSRDEVDRDERNVIFQKQKIVAIERALALIPSRVEALHASLNSAMVSLNLARRELERTVISAPFNCRIGEVSLQEGQIVQVGQQLFEAHGTDAIEVEAKFRPAQLRTLLSPEKRLAIASGISLEKIQKLFDLTVEVHLTGGTFRATWPARFERFRERVDPRTRDMSVVSVVDRPYEKAIPGVRPPLIPGMYCTVDLTAKPQNNVIVVPVSAVRDGFCYLVDKDNRLYSKSVTADFSVGDFLIVSGGLEEGDRIVLSDPGPAIEGMSVLPVKDVETERRIATLTIVQAGGEQ
jgi:RND family efflux transporter MFP subunit